MPDLTHTLKILTDDFTPVRDTLGRLLGAVPRVPDTADAIRDTAGNVFELRVAAQVCVCVADGQSPLGLAGFTPLDTAQADLATSVTQDDDLAESV